MAGLGRPRERAEVAPLQVVRESAGDAVSGGGRATQE